MTVHPDNWVCPRCGNRIRPSRGKHGRVRQPGMCPRCFFIRGASEDTRASSPSGREGPRAAANQESGATSKEK